MNNFKDFDIKFQRILDEKGYTQRSFAKKINKSSPYINSLCVGKRKPTAKTVKEIADALGVPVSYFVSEDKSVSQQANGNAGSVSQSVALGGDVGAKLEVVAAKLEAITAKLDVVLEMLRNMKK